jgi:hypothetical protein
LLLLVNSFTSLQHQKSLTGRVPSLMPVILATQEAEIRRITVQSQPGQIVHETQSQKRAGGVAQGVGSGWYCKKKKKIPNSRLPTRQAWSPEFKPQGHKKNWDLFLKYSSHISRA